MVKKNYLSILPIYHLLDSLHGLETKECKNGEKCGMTKEVVIRKVRFLNNQYYDSVKYGILWEELAD